MLKQQPRRSLFHYSGNFLPLLLLCLTFFGVTGCGNLLNSNNQESAEITESESIGVDIETEQDAEEWQETNTSSDRLTTIEKDVAFLLTKVGKTSDVQQTPMANSNKELTSSTSGYAPCPEPFTNHYKKSIGFVSFPRVQPVTSNVGALHQVELHLPLLIGANLHNRHALLTPIQIHETLADVNKHGELAAAAQAQTLSRQHRVQFFVSGEVDDMSMRFPDTLGKPSYYTRFISGTHNLLHINTPLDKRSRIFSFTVQVRDGITGQIVFSNQYQTFGKWKAGPETEMGFGSPRFWSTDYGRQIQQLVAKASDELASAVHCQPYMARVDSRPYQQQVVIHSGANNGLRRGDQLELYQIVHQPVAGEYQRFDTRLIKRNGKVQLTEIYPSHSIGNVVEETLTGGQYAVKAR